MSDVINYSEHSKAGIYNEDLAVWMQLFVKDKF